ncbi:tyrosine--tRNA ligase [Clostridium oryzae]|uniref:Tyrosine--tRNA ligase n=1 Tax=Clostridium oryzae TaxID=1450648 RepID=A0A1V4IS79_9CLOT|nr:tyrosine--tRNA ligase [Clostridium oryzae]OPJ62763.1 tyrosine--tRNA ligase [Clostridium oryzae]
MSGNLFEILKERGYVYQATHEDMIREALNGEPITFYLGIDPTADSLHIGHFFALMMFRYLQDSGHKGILVVGGATALIGDPTGKSDMRKMLSKEQVQHNVEEVKALAKRFIKTDGDNPAIILSNDEWMHDYSFVDFMRDIGIHFNVNKMLSSEIYTNRLKEGGLTFLEMGYMLMQSYDFVYLNKKYGCKLQIGGSDQWGNIVAGVNLLRKMNFQNDDEVDKIFGLTCPLLMTKEGKKMGKTENGTLWVAREKTTVFDFYQYFYNVKDEDTETLLRLFTRVPLEQILTLCKDDIIAAKRLMAYEITKLVHGEEEANKAAEAAKGLFKTGAVKEDMPKKELDKKFIAEGINIIDLLTESGFISSKSEARRLIAQGGICINNEKVQNFNKIVNEGDLRDGYVMLKRGKKNYLKVVFE